MTVSPQRAELRAAHKHCRSIARRTAGNFYYSFLVLPRKQRQGMESLYSFARLTDDIADGPEPLAARRSHLMDWRFRLEKALGGERPSDPVMLALMDVVRRHSIPPILLRTLIDGVDCDLDGGRFAAFADLYHYSYQVASTIGLSCIRIWGVRDSAAHLPAEWCGVAMQLTNILRDLREDHARGRVYLPQDELTNFGVDEEQLGGDEMTPQLRRLLEFQIARAHDYYERGSALFDYLPPKGRAVLRVMIDIYRGLLRAIERRPERVLRGRVALSTPKKLALALRGFI